MTLAAIASLDAPRKATPAQDWARALETIGRATRDPDRTLTRAVAEWARRYGDEPALLSDRENYSFRALESWMNQYSRWALDVRIRPGETVALLMGNRPEYFAIWLGLIQVGAVVALVNPGLGGAALSHAFTVSGARLVITAAENFARCEEAISNQKDVEAWIHGGDDSQARRIDLAISTQSGAPLDPARLPRI